MIVVNRNLLDLQGKRSSRAANGPITSKQPEQRSYFQANHDAHQRVFVCARAKDILFCVRVPVRHKTVK